MLLFIHLNTSSKAGTGKHSSMVRSFRALKSTTGLNDPSDFGTNNNGLDHSDELGGFYMLAGGLGLSLALI